MAAPCRHSITGEEGLIVELNGHKTSFAYRLCNYPLGVLPAWLEKFRGASILDKDTCTNCPLYAEKLSEPERESRRTEEA